MRHLAAAVGVLGLLGTWGLAARHQATYRDTVLDPSDQLVAQPVVAPVPPALRPPRPVSRSTARTVVSASWVERTATAAGIPVPALRAYATATLQVPGSCGLGWTTLAGIGWVESQHGTIGGRSVSDDGHPSEPILGPALDGSGRFAAIPATPESATWHGDPDWDHAVGPMQFIPGTWETWATDGDGDGLADPHDLDDAALAAARYLCASGTLATGAGWAAAVLSYNHEQVYVDAVRAAAEAYAARTA